MPVNSIHMPLSLHCGLQGYFECLRTEKVGQRLDITMVCPGPVVSNLGNVCFTEKHGEVRTRAEGREGRGRKGRVGQGREG